jgi:hypothetical protein
MFYPGSGSKHFYMLDPGSGSEHFFIPDPETKITYPRSGSWIQTVKMHWIGISNTGLEF